MEGSMRKIIGISGALLSIGLLFGGCKPAVQQAQDTAISFCKDPEIKTRLMNIIEKQHAETLGSVGLGSAPRAVQRSIQKFIKNRDLRPPRAAA
jgi:hypothetical protein